MIRIRASYLEAFRRCVDTEWGDEGSLARAIRGEPDPPNWMMEAGSAWHSLLADFAQGLCFTDDLDDVFSSGGYQFPAQDIARAQGCIGPGLWEVPGSIEIIPGVMLEGKADHVRGLVITDNKTKFSTSDAADYEQSLQWRTYLLVHGAAAFRYCLWRMTKPDKEGCCRLTGAMVFKFWRYAELEADVRSWVETFLDWAHKKKLIAHLERDPYWEAA